MSEALMQGLACAAGAVLGTVFFGGLWWTVRRGVSSKWAGLWFFSSWLVRMSLALAGFYVVSAGHWERLMFCLLGFMTARLAVAWLTRTPGKPSRLTVEA